MHSALVRWRGLCLVVAVVAPACSEQAPAGVDFRGGDDGPPDVYPGLSYEAFMELEEERLTALGETVAAELHAALVAELGMDPSEVDKGYYDGDDLAALHGKIDEVPWDTESFKDYFEWAQSEYESPAQYWESVGYADFGQTTFGLSAACEEVVAEYGGLGQVLPIDTTVVEGRSTNHPLPVNLLPGMSVAVGCTPIRPGSGWTRDVVDLGFGGRWPGHKHSTGARFAVHEPFGGLVGDLLVSSNRPGSIKAANLHLDATSASAGNRYSLFCEAAAFSREEGEGTEVAAARYCVDVDVITQEPEEPAIDCSTLEPMTVEVERPGRALSPGEPFTIRATWDAPAGFLRQTCMPFGPLGHIDVSSTPAGALIYGGSIGRNADSTRAHTTGSTVTMEMDGPSTHVFTVDPGTTEDSASVELELSDWGGKILTKLVPIDIVQGPEFNTTYSSACPNNDYCWRFFNYYGEGRAGPPTPGQVLTGTFSVSNVGNADLEVTATSPTGMYALTSSPALTIPAAYHGGGHWFASDTYTLEFTTPAEADLPSLCTLDGTTWSCEEDLTLTTNDPDPAQQTVIVRLSTRFPARDVLTVHDETGVETPEVLDLGTVRLGDTELVTVSGSPQVEACPAGHLMRALEVRNSGIPARTHARLLPSDVDNTAGAFLLNGPASRLLLTGGSMELDLCILPKETGIFEERLEIWQSTFPHDSMDITLRYDAREPVEVHWANAPFADGDTLDFGVLSAGTPAPLDIGPIEVSNHTSADISVVLYRSMGVSTWEVHDVGDADGNPFNPSYPWLLHPGESMSYRLDLLDTSAGPKTGEITISWGTPNGTTGPTNRQVTGYQTIDRIKIPLAIEMQ